VQVAVIVGTPRVLSVVAATDIHVFKISKTNFMRLLYRSPVGSMRLSAQIDR
jgi:CRP-like cAMP-binding protein